MTQPSSDSNPECPDRLDLPDVTQLLRLMGELAYHREDPRSWRLALLSALNQLLPATASAAFILKNITPDSPPIVVSLFDVGFKVESHRQAFLREFNAAPFRDPFSRRCIDRFLETRPKCLTALRSDFVDDDTWYKSPHVEEFRRPANTDDCLLSIYRGADRGNALALCALRSWGDASRFTPRDRALVNTLHSGLEWMYRAEDTTHRLNRATASAPRLRQTLDFLLAGDTERQVALKMNLSVHTVHDYVKALYAHFGVSSRSELIARWRQTGGNPTPT